MDIICLFSRNSTREKKTNNKDSSLSSETKPHCHGQKQGYRCKKHNAHQQV